MGGPTGRAECSQSGGPTFGRTDSVKMNDAKESDNDINGYDYAHDDNGVLDHRTCIGVDPIDDDNADGANDDEATSDDDDDNDEQNIEARDRCASAARAVEAATTAWAAQPLPCLVRLLDLWAARFPEYCCAERSLCRSWDRPTVYSTVRRRGELHAGD